VNTGMITPNGHVKDQGEDEDDSLPTLYETDRLAIFSNFHNSIVGHFGINKTLDAMYGWQDHIEYHLYTV
jgi:hypothetical protein